MLSEVFAALRCFKAFVLLGCLLLVSGCGYGLSGSGTILPPEVRKIYIPVVENNSSETGLSSTMTDAFRDQFERYGVVGVVDDLSEADATLKVKILKVNRQTSASKSKTDTALEFDTEVILSAELKRRSGVVLWRNPRLIMSRSVASAGRAVVTSSPQFLQGTLSSSDISALGRREVARNQQQEAFDLIASEAARLVYDQAVAEDF